MANITTRAGKGSPLTYDEVDGNFTSLNSSKLETNAVSTDGTFSANSDALIPTQKAAKTYIDTKFTSGVTSFNGANVSLVSGNLNFSGTGQRITGDMSNGTFTSRVAFQTTTANSTTNVHAIPNGTATGAGFKAESDPTFANGQFAALDIVGGSDARVTSGTRGTGTALPLTFYTGNAERVRIDTSGNVGIGTSAPGGIRLNISTPGASSGETGLVVNNPNTSAYSTVYTSYFTAGGNRAQVIAQQVASTSGGVLILSTANSSGTITEALRIDSSQNVGIGGSPANKFDVQGADGSAVYFRTPSSTQTGAQINLNTNVSSTNPVYGFFYDGTTGLGHPTYQTASIITAGAERVRIDSSGNVGIGTSAPGTKLDVNGIVNTSTGYQFGSDADYLYQSSANTATLRVGTSTNQSYFGFRAVGGTPTLDAPAGILGLSTSGLERFRIDNSGNAQLGSANATAAAGVRYFDVYNLENTNSSSASNIRAITQNAAGTGAVSVDIVKYKSGLFSIINNETSAGSAITLGTVGTERMRIDSGGNVGIGVSSPSIYGHLVAQGAFAGTSNSNLSLLTTGAAQGEQADIALYSTFQGTADNSPRRTADIIAGFNGGSWGNEYLTFNVGNGGAANDTRVVTSEKMRITSAGYVGIGTNTPSTYGKLTVTGNIVFGGPGGRNTAFTNNIGIWTSGDPLDDTRANIGFTTVAGASSSSSYISFNTNSYGVSAGERVRIDQNGNFSVGTTGGDFGRSFRGVFRQDQNATTQVGVINATIGASAIARYSRIGGTGNSFCDWDLADNNGAPVDVYSYGSAVGSTVWSYAATERMRLTSAGSLGIGTPTPGQKLDVTTSANDDGIIVNNSSTNGGRVRINSSGTGGRTYSLTSTANGNGQGGGKFLITDITASDTTRFAIDSSGNVGLGTSSPTQKLTVNGAVGYNAPVSITTATYTVAATDNWLIANFAGTVTLTLPAASSFTGRIITVKNVQAQTVVSASLDVVPIGSTTAGTAILAATAGKFATLVSDGTNWIVMQAN